MTTSGPTIARRTAFLAVLLWLGGCAASTTRHLAPPVTGNADIIRARAALAVGQWAVAVRAVDKLLCNDRTEPRGAVSASADEAEEIVRAALRHRSSAEVLGWVRTGTARCALDTIASTATALDAAGEATGTLAQEILCGLRALRPADAMAPLWRQHCLIAAERRFISSRQPEQPPMPADFAAVVSPHISDLLALTDERSRWSKRWLQVGDWQPLCRAASARADALHQRAFVRRAVSRKALSASQDLAQQQLLAIAAIEATDRYSRRDWLVSACCGEQGQTARAGPSLQHFCEGEARRRALALDHLLGAWTTRILLMVKSGTLDRRYRSLLTGSKGDEDRLVQGWRGPAPAAIVGWMHSAERFLQARSGSADVITARLWRQFVSAAALLATVHWPERAPRLIATALSQGSKTPQSSAREAMLHRLKRRLLRTKTTR